MSGTADLNVAVTLPRDEPNASRRRDDSVNWASVSDRLITRERDGYVGGPMIRSQNNLIWMTSQRIVRSAVVAICCAAALTSAQAADPQPVPTAEIRDVILMLDNGPLHVRLHVSVGKKAPAEARRGTM